MNKIVLALILCIMALGCEPKAQSDNIETVQTEVFEQHLKLEAPQLVDARTAAEFEAGHIDGAQHMDVLQPDRFRSQIQKLDKTKPVMVYCKTGKRSMKAAQIMEENGFTKIINLDGGYTAWKKKNP